MAEERRAAEEAREERLHFGVMMGWEGFSVFAVSLTDTWFSPLVWNGEVESPSPPSPVNP